MITFILIIIAMTLVIDAISNFYTRVNNQIIVNKNNVDLQETIKELKQERDILIQLSKGKYDSCAFAFTSQGTVLLPKDWKKKLAIEPTPAASEIEAKE